MRVLVTGAGGYVGRATVAALRKAGHTPVALVHQAVEPDEVETHVGDVLVPESLLAPLDQVDAVVHLAGMTRARESWQEPARFFQVNAAGTANLLAAMAARGVGRLVLASTGAIYGSPETQPMNEDLADDIPHPYAASKRAAELAVEWQARSGAVGAVIVRLFNVAGGVDPDPTRLVPRVLAAAAGASSSLKVNGDGSAVRDLLHVDDAAAAFVAAVEHVPPIGEVRRYNIGSGMGSSVMDVVAAAERVTGRHIPLVYRPPAAEPPTLVADPARAEAELNWKPARSTLDEILADAWQAVSRA
ncbi:NAD-dependent epimerase/dehydratase family protein [Actinokineospora sp.]|uniref:NAD-dependent epimerase/dehydratase family protein n=1 Tax=Actinokineospora sp. TaxID=1872133 RepID=UPI003D6C2397